MIQTPGPGLYPNTPDTVYHSWAGASQSRLKVLKDRSPAHLRYEMDHPKEPTPAQIVGSAIHDAILLPDVFKDRYAAAGQCEAITGKGTRCTNTGSVSHGGRWFCGVKGHDPGGLPDQAVVLPASDYAACIGIRDRVWQHPDAQVLLDCQRKELSAIWDDEGSGVRCKGRLDGLSDDGQIVVDIKSTTDASKGAFSSAIYNYGYYVQAAHYLRGANTLEIPAKMFGIIAVEKEPPYELAVYEVHGEAIDAGVVELRPLLELYRQCLETDTWPGYPEGAIPITLPPWAWRQVEQRAREAKEEAEA